MEPRLKSNHYELCARLITSFNDEIIEVNLVVLANRAPARPAARTVEARQLGHKLVRAEYLRAAHDDLAAQRGGQRVRLPRPAPVPHNTTISKCQETSGQAREEDAASGCGYTGAPRGLVSRV